MALHRQERWRETMAREVLLPKAKRQRFVAPAFHHHVPSFPANFQYQKIPAAMPVPTIPNKPVSLRPMQGQGFTFKNPNPGFDVVRPPIMVKPVPFQGFQPQQYGQAFFPSQHHQEVQGFAVQNPSAGVFTSTTVNRVDQVSGLNQHQAPTSSLLRVYATLSSTVPETPGTRPVAPVSHQVRLDQLLSSSVLSELIQSIKAQGLLSQLPKEEAPVEDDAPSEFDAAWLKVHHESVIKSLYSDIPRQCQTCGRRFKTREEHSKHMDWHVKKNREIKKMKKAEVKPSKPWFFTQSIWLKATETLKETSYGGPLPSFMPDSTLEIRKDEEFSVPADEDQKLCALCREAFEDFYSDETEDWMYKGAVYMNTRNGSMASGKDRAKLGPLVHAKCLPETKQL